jgi:hypothetical protein
VKSAIIGGQDKKTNIFIVKNAESVLMDNKKIHFTVVNAILVA